MAILSTGSNTLSNFAVHGIALATQRLQDSTEKLASSNRLIRAGEDVAAMSVATQLRSSITAMRQALSNTAQATSLFQIASDGLTQINDALGAMQALATQANSASLSAADFANLNLQFQNYMEEIDSLAQSTSFNNIKLLDGSATDENVASTTTTNATAAQASLNFGVNIGGGKTIVINGTTFTEGVQFAAGGTIQASIDNLVVALQSSTNAAVTQASYQRVGNSLEVTHRAGGSYGNQFFINQNSSTATFATAGGLTSIANRFTLQGGIDNGLAGNSVKVSGTIGDALVNTQDQTQASTTLTITGAVAAGQQIRVDDSNGGFINFTFSAAPALNTDILIGANTSDTIANAVSTINSYTNTNDYGNRQLEATRSGVNTLTLTSTSPGNPLDLAGAAINVAETMANGAFSNTTLNNGVNTGVSVAGVMNEDFYGSVSGFSANFVAGNSITASLTVGSATYNATITNTAPGAPTNARFTSANNGYFDVQIAAGGMAVGDQTDADTFASRLDAAFSSLTFTQTRNASSFVAAGQLAGSSVQFSSDDFSDDLTINDINVLTPAGAGLDATIEFTINGEVYRNQPGIGNFVGDNETLKFTNVNNGNKSLTLRQGSIQIDLSSQALADTFEASLKSAFNFGTGGGAITFQVGAGNHDVLSARIDGVTTAKLFGGATYDLLSQANAVAAGTAVQTAIDTVTGVQASVGSYQSRVGYASAYLSDAITHTDEARSALEDTDIVAESTEFAVATVMQQAGISVLAQTNALQSSLLTLLDPNN